MTVVAAPDILAIQAGRLVRRSHSADVVTPLPTTIGDTLRVLWESERESVIVVGTLGRLGARRNRRHDYAARPVRRRKRFSTPP